MTPPGRSLFKPQGHGWQGLYKEGHYIHSYTQNMKALGLVVLEKNIVLCFFPIVSLWELSVAMETRVLI